MKKVLYIRRIVHGAQSVLALVGVVIAWQVSTACFDIPGWLLPSPVEVVLAAYQYRALLPLHIGATLFETVAGLLVALAIGLPLSILIVWAPVLRRTVYPVVLAAQSIPKVAIAPLFLIWIGYGMFSKVLVAASVAFFPIVVSTVTGLTLIDENLLEMFKVMRASKLQTFLRVRIPTAMPYFFSGTKIAVMLAVIGAIVGEYVGSDRGLGYLILASGARLNTAVVFLSITLLSIIGMALYWLTGVLQRALVPWSSEDETVIF
jgi:NitT/TauT family transport system permease protein